MDALFTPVSTSLSTLPAVLLPQTAEQDRSLTLLHGPSEAIGRLWSQVRTVAPHFRTLLLNGERGCGADTVAHLLHSLSPYRTGTLLRLDPASAQKRLRSPKRLLREVTGGVLYLTDVDQLSAPAQEDLRRFMRFNRLHPCALLASSSRDLRSLATAGSFSPALAESLGSFCVQIPSLRDRREDIPWLAESLLREACNAAGTAVPALAPSFAEEASAFDWPENLDQLRSALSIFASKPHGNALEATDLRYALDQLQSAPKTIETPAARMIKLDLVIQEHIRCVLIACQGNKLRASEVLGISRSTLYRMLETGTSHSLSLLA